MMNDGWQSPVIVLNMILAVLGIPSLGILLWWMLGTSSRRRKRRVTLASMWLRGFRMRVVFVTSGFTGRGRVLAVGLELSFVSKQRRKTGGFIENLPIGVSRRFLRTDRRGGG